MKYSLIYYYLATALYRGLELFFLNHTKLQANDFYVFGESYGGN
jgi:carboxypeptidase C (cathepsin A)